eukprot:TRINITY_DN360_c0_g1_i1.p1 TRINITY_DN360_c0_g1~~TRINITY_DN360_c0_g1_i1.p1  ORF type:complete len:615 (+),score=159.05 TRINITY_DN360_c0_g1_i1:50-1894(+)
MNPQQTPQGYPPGQPPPSTAKTPSGVPPSGFPPGYQPPPSSQVPSGVPPSGFPPGYQPPPSSQVPGGAPPPTGFPPGYQPPPGSYPPGQSPQPGQYPPGQAPQVQPLSYNPSQVPQGQPGQCQPGQYPPGQAPQGQPGQYPPGLAPQGQPISYNPSQVPQGQPGQYPPPGQYPLPGQGGQYQPNQGYPPNVLPSQMAPGQYPSYAGFPPSGNYSYQPQNYPQYPPPGTQPGQPVQHNQTQPLPYPPGQHPSVYHQSSVVPNFPPVPQHSVVPTVTSTTVVTTQHVHGDPKLYSYPLLVQQPSRGVDLPSFITLEIIEAKGLLAADSNGKSDPYVKILDRTGLHLDGKPYLKTKTIKKTLSPVWNATFKISINHKLSSLKLLVYDYDVLSQDDKIGEVDIPVDVLMDQKPHEDWWNLKPKGQIRLRMKIDWGFPILLPGQSTSVVGPKVVVGLGWDLIGHKAVDLDASVVGFDKEFKKVDVVSFRHLKGFGGAVVHSGDNRTGVGVGDDEEISVNMPKVPSSVTTLVFVVNSFHGVPFSQIQSAYIRVREKGKKSKRTYCYYRFGRMANKCGLVLGYLYKDPHSGWLFRAYNYFCDGKTVDECLGQIMGFLAAGN